MDKLAQYYDLLLLKKRSHEIQRVSHGLGEPPPQRRGRLALGLGAQELHLGRLLYLL